MATARQPALPIPFLLMSKSRSRCKPPRLAAIEVAPSSPSTLSLRKEQVKGQQGRDLSTATFVREFLKSEAHFNRGKRRAPKTGETRRLFQLTQDGEFEAQGDQKWTKILLQLLQNQICFPCKLCDRGGGWQWVRGRCRWMLECCGRGLLGQGEVGLGSWSVLQCRGEGGRVVWWGL